MKSELKSACSKGLTKEVIEKITKRPCVGTCREDLLRNIMPCVRSGCRIGRTRDREAHQCRPAQCALALSTAPVSASYDRACSTECASGCVCTCVGVERERYLKGTSEEVNAKAARRQYAKLV